MDYEIESIIADLNLVRDQTTEWTGVTLDLQMEYSVLDYVHTGFAAPEYVIGPYEIDDELLNEYVTTDTDFVYLVSGMKDRQLGLHLSYWWGDSYGDYSIHGESNSYIQNNQDVCNMITIAGERVYEALENERIHNLDWALYYVHEEPDRYQYESPDWATWEHASWPGCGTGSSDPTDWFPSIDLCEWDRDWIDRNNVESAGACNHSDETDGNISWYEHVLATHYPRDLEFNGNFCSDGKQDFSETGTDSGWPCP